MRKRSLNPVLAIVLVLAGFVGVGLTCWRFMDGMSASTSFGTVSGKVTKVSADQAGQSYTVDFEEGNSVVFQNPIPVAVNGKECTIVYRRREMAGYQTKYYVLSVKIGEQVFPADN